MLKLAVLVSGGGTNLQAIIDRIEDGYIPNTKIEVIISNNKNAYALERGVLHNIPSCCISPKDYGSREAYYEALLVALTKEEIDYIILAGFLVAIPEKIIKLFRNRIINIHPSLLPSFCGTGYYGLRVHEAALARGVKVTGATVHFVDEGCDTGPIILQKPVAVKPEDTPEILQKRVMQEAEWVILTETIRLLAQNKVRIQDGKVHISDGGSL